MKNASIFSTILLIVSTLFLTQTAQAQLAQNSTTKTITTNTDFNNAANAILGIGTATPSNAKLNVQGAIGNTVASFRKSATGKGVSIVSDWPGVYFNAYYNGAGKSMAPGHAGIINFDPDQGRFDFALSGTASGAANTTVDLTPRMSINKDGVVAIGAGTSNKAKLVVQGAVGSTSGIFGDGAQGISLNQNWPSVGFNAYYSPQGWRTMAAGYGMAWNCDPNSGRALLQLHGYAAANAAPNTSVPLLVEPNGNVGVGVSAADKAKLVVKGAVGSTTAMFGEGAQGISLMQNWPGVGFNAYYSASGWRAMAAGYGMAWNLDPVTGRAALQLHGTTAAGQIPTQSVPFFVEADGRVAIGAPKAANGYHLSVGGKVICEELKVQLKGAWPDYVFADNYELKPLSEVEAHIKSEKHLPGIPAAAELEKEGLEVGDMQKRMMEKIEELTLYVIKINKENEALKQRVELLESNK